MARPVESDTETHKYLIEVIRQTRDTKQLAEIIIANNIEIPWTRIPTGSNRSVADWQTELRQYDIHQQLDPRTNTHQPTHPYQNQTQQAPNPLGRWQTIAPKSTQSVVKLTPPTNASGPPSSSVKKRGRPSKKQLEERDAAASVEQKKSEQDTQARPVKRARQNPPTLNTRPPIASNTPSLMSATTSTTSPATATQSSAGPDSASFTAFSGIPATMGLAISSALSQPIARPAGQHPRLPGPNILTSPTANVQTSRTLPVPRPTDYTQRDSAFTYPGIPASSGPTTTFFGVPSSYPQSYIRPTTPSYAPPFQSPLPTPQQQYNYEGLQPRFNKPRRSDDDTMEH